MILKENKIFRKMFIVTEYAALTGPMYYIISGLDKQKVSVFLTCVLGAQKKSLIETILLSTHNICLEFKWDTIANTYHQSMVHHCKYSLFYL